MRKTLFIMIAMLLVISVFSASEYLIYTELVEKSQFLDEKGNLTGSSVEIVEEILRRLGETKKIDIKQWDAAYNELKEKDNVILFSTGLTDDRKDLFKWAGPILVKTWTFFVRKGSGIEIDSLEDAKKLERIGTIKEDAREQYLKANGFQNIISGTDYLENIQKLYDGELDALIESPVSFNETCLRGGFDPNDFQVALVVRETNNYIAFSKDFPEEVYLNWRNTLKEMYEDGTFEQIYRKWHPDSQPPEFSIVE